MSREPDSWGPSFVIVLIVVAGFLFAMFCGYRIGYQDGQEKAMEGQWFYSRVVQSDGRVIYRPLATPTTQPVVIREVPQ